MRPVMKTETKTPRGTREALRPASGTSLGLLDCVAQVTGVAAMEAGGLPAEAKCCNHLRRRNAAARGRVA